jgi:hypothetical protein
MVNALFELGRQYILAGTVNMTSDTIAVSLLDLNTADVGIKLISSSTNATPIVITTTAAHGFTNGDLVYVGDHLVNTAGNGLWTITAAAGSVFSLTDPVSGANAVGNGVGATTGYCVNYGPSTAADFYDDFDGALVGAKVTLASKTFASGVFDAADPTFTAVSGASVEAILIFKDTGTNSSSNVLGIITGRHIVTADALASSTATTIVVEPLRGSIASGAVLAFSNGASATLTAPGVVGDRTLTVSSLAANITSGSRALASAVGSGLPVTPNGGNILVTFDNGANRIFKL